jgi:hypothetical protein
MPVNEVAERDAGRLYRFDGCASLDVDGMTSRMEDMLERTLRRLRASA